MEDSYELEKDDGRWAVSSDFIQSEIALRTVSTQRHHPSRKMIDQGLEQVEQKNKVSQNLHNSTVLSE